MVIKMDKKTFKMIIFSVIIIIIVFVMCILFTKLNSKKEEYNHLKNYSVNEYIPTYVSTEDLCKIYLNDYLFNMRYNPEVAYNSLDSLYKEKKFGSLDEYKNYISNYDFSNIYAKKYETFTKGKYRFYKIYASDNNTYIFKTKGIMQYSIYLDENTVEIG